VKRKNHAEKQAENNQLTSALIYQHEMDEAAALSMKKLATEATMRLLTVKDSSINCFMRNFSSRLFTGKKLQQVNDISLD
jgi:uncharacterized GH25 family protein